MLRAADLMAPKMAQQMPQSKSGMAYWLDLPDNWYPIIGQSRYPISYWSQILSITDIFEKADITNNRYAIPDPNACMQSQSITQSNLEI